MFCRDIISSSSSPIELVCSFPSLTRRGSITSTSSLGDWGVRLLRWRRRTFPGRNVGEGSVRRPVVRRRGILISWGGGLSVDKCVPLYFAGGADDACFTGRAGDRSRRTAWVGRNRS